jgi:hypothetical protein
MYRDFFYLLMDPLASAPARSMLSSSPIKSLSPDFIVAKDK